nr:capping protein, Arp2/3 and myosin-I linker protein 2-like isoform X1 [Paramormyrops kingsleyae]XP_023683131.1 capping protein, Arp2/3 and myosin-I linker protein 2-like isoform X1 [Paramormyrops kingsleyae]XP_023683132.1 capping protein, Arp2/3 and myosin-I linker protein 2-like isoform X1 [Paramormyrops kingsleyae]
MDLPIEEQRLRHYTSSRPRPNRRNRQPPSKPQEQAADSENDASDTMGRVDEGVEEFFTKKIIPSNPLKYQKEGPLVKASATEPACSTPPTGPTRNIKKKFGDFFAFKKVRGGRGSKGEGAQEGKVKKTSIADLIRPLREAARAEKEREREREREKEKEREREKEKADEDNAIKGSAAPPAAPAVAVTEVGDEEAPGGPSPPPSPTPELTPVSPTAATAGIATLSTSPTPVPAVGREKSRTPDGERKLKGSRRSLREGKSQSLILLTGLEPEDRTKKPSSEGTPSFEQRVHLMLHRMGVTKTSPPDPKKVQQNKEGELRKADSEGTIIDSKPEPPPTKPRTMSTSSDTRRPVRGGMTALESLRAVEAVERPPPPERPSPLTPKPIIKPPLLTPESPAALRTSPWTTSQSSPAREGPPAEPGAAQLLESVSPRRETPSPWREIPPVPSPRRTVVPGDSRDRSERAQSVTEDTLPKPRPRTKPSPQRRAISVHEESLREQAAFLDPEELKAALPRLQRSPVRKWANHGELAPCSEALPEGDEAGKRTSGESEQSKETGGEMVTLQHNVQGGPSDQRTDPPQFLKDMN